MNENWTKPKDEHIVYEALSAIADNRIELINNASAKCFSTSGNKFYSISYDLENNLIMSNDNMAYYRDEVSYPMIAVLLKLDMFDFDKTILKYFKNIKWKDINQKNKNNYMKSVADVLDSLKQKGIDIDNIQKEVNKIFAYINTLDLLKLGKKTNPPNAY